MQQAIIEALSAAYQAPDRFFHNLDHIQACLRELDDALGNGVTVEDPAAVKFAIWFHDAVYDGTRTDNEERSADEAYVAALRHGYGDDFAERVKWLVLVTKHSVFEPETADEELICDIDLASLAADDFSGNTGLIRREYAHVPDEEFYPARRRILAKFLERSRIYRTEFFAVKYEIRARENLRVACAVGD